MRYVTKPLAGITVIIAIAAGWMIGSGILRSTQYARAEQQVDATRAQIANVQDMATVFKAVNKAVEPSVVKIEIEKTTAGRGGRGNNPLFQWFPDRDGDGQPDVPEGFPDLPQNQQIQEGTGSGVIIETNGNTGYIVTNNHVAAGASKTTVFLSDGREIKNAKLVGTDPKSDIAVLKIDAEGLIPAKWGNSDQVEKGDIICAFGSPFGYSGSMTHGIVSALNRQNVGILRSQFSYENFIQVDAPINPGNSGGPLVNLHGEVVGINTAIATESGGFQGLGFAIPSNQAKYVYEMIKSNGRVVRGWLGVAIKDVSELADEVKSLGFADRTGVVIKETYRKTPAYGFLQPEDVVTEINGKKVSDSQELRTTVASMAPGSEVTMKVFRNHQNQDVKVTLGEQPPDLQQASLTSTPARPDNAQTQTTGDVIGFHDSTATPGLLKTNNIDDADVKGAIITEVRRGSLAERALLRPGDCITQVNDIKVASSEELDAALAKADVNKGITFFVTNARSSKSVFVKAGDE